MYIKCVRNVISSGISYKRLSKMNVVGHSGFSLIFLNIFHHLSYKYKC